MTYLDFDSLRTNASETTRTVPDWACANNAQLQGDPQNRYFHGESSLAFKKENEIADAEFLRRRMRSHATHEVDSLSRVLQMRGIRHVCCALEAATTSATTEYRRQPVVVVARRGLEHKRHHRCAQCKVDPVKPVVICGTEVSV